VGRLEQRAFGQGAARLPRVPFAVRLLRPAPSHFTPRRALQVKGTSKEDAQKAYIALVTKLLGA
jgi:hypothetical protein